jgi:hypothetical protein
MMLDRGLQTQFVGAPIDSLTGVYGDVLTTYGTGTLLSKLQSVVFTNPAGDSLLYDYNKNKWAQISANASGPIASIVQRGDGLIYAAQQSVSGATLPTTYSCSGTGGAQNNGISVMYTANQTTSFNSQTNITQALYGVETPWITLGEGPAGEGAIWGMQLLGQYVNPHILYIETAVNYGTYNASPQMFPINSAPTSGYQFRVGTPKGVRASSVRYRISISPPSPAPSTNATAADFVHITGIQILSGTMQGNTYLGNGNTL